MRFKYSDPTSRNGTMLILGSEHEMNVAKASLPNSIHWVKRPDGSYQIDRKYDMMLTQALLKHGMYAQSIIGPITRELKTTWGPEQSRSNRRSRISSQSRTNSRNSHVTIQATKRSLNRSRSQSRSTSRKRERSVRSHTGATTQTSKIKSRLSK